MNPRSLALEQVQIEKLNYVLGEIWERNPFYTYKWCRAGVSTHHLASIEELSLFPFTTRAELLLDQQSTPPLGANLTCPAYALKRICRSSGTTQSPLYWADTPKTWAWVIRCSESLFLMAGITPEDRILFTFSVGQSAGPCIMHEGACRLGCCCFTSGIEDEQLHRLRLFRPNVLVGKPSHLRKIALELESSGPSAQSYRIDKLVLTGESASNSTRQQLKQLWNADSFDRYGLTEAGSVAGECPAHPGGVHVLESEFAAEVVDPSTGQPVPEGALGELVLTTLGRVARPIVRYRTGDLVRVIRDHQCPCGRAEALLVGGVSRIPAEMSTNFGPTSAKMREAGYGRSN